MTEILPSIQDNTGKEAWSLDTYHGAPFDDAVLRADQINPEHVRVVTIPEHGRGIIEGTKQIGEMEFTVATVNKQDGDQKTVVFKSEALQARRDELRASRTAARKPIARAAFIDVQRGPTAEELNIAAGLSADFHYVKPRPQTPRRA